MSKIQLFFTKIRGRNVVCVGFNIIRFKVQWCCPKYKTAECDDPGHTWTGWYNDEWNKKNERLWVSNRQELELLQPYGDGGACANPTASEIRVRPTGSSAFQEWNNMFI